MKHITIVAALLASACGPTSEQIEKVKAELPSGCQLRDLGDYGRISDLVVVTCDGRATATANGVEQHGKSHTYFGNYKVDVPNRMM